MAMVIWFRPNIPWISLTPGLAIFVPVFNQGRHRVLEHLYDALETCKLELNALARHIQALRQR